MKLFYCLLAFFLLTVHFCQAQIPLKIKAGAALSNMLVTDLQGHAIVTWYGGVATSLQMSKRLFFQPELLISQRGADLRSSFPGTYISITRRYGYISMPLLLGWHPFKKMSLLFGAEPGYMLWDSSPRGAYYERTYEDVDRRFNVDIDLGLAFQPLPRWTIEARGMIGLIGVYDEWGQSRMSVYKTGEHVGNHVTAQLGLSYALKRNNSKASH